MSSGVSEHPPAEPRPRHPDGLPPGLASLDRCLVMGVLNVTPDSFSDGGLWADADAAVARGLALVADGADLVDVGGESTRPGAGRIPVEEEMRRVLPVISELAAAGVVVSVDTMRAEVADAALACGAGLVNDVSGGLADPAMADLVADARVPFVAMHWRGPSDRMEQLAHYADVVTEVREELLLRVEALTAAGVEPARIVLDPGFGFAKRASHGWRLLARLPDLTALGHPLLIGTSRKRFLGEAVASAADASTTVGASAADASTTVGASAADASTTVGASAADRDAATAATSALAAAAGAWAVRVHEVRASADAVRVVAAVSAAAHRGAPS